MYKNDTLVYTISKAQLGLLPIRTVHFIKYHHGQALLIF